MLRPPRAGIVAVSPWPVISEQRLRPAKLPQRTSRGMSCADTRAMHVTKTIRKRAAMHAARDTWMDYLVDVDPGQTTPWCCLVTGPIPL